LNKRERLEKTIAGEPTDRSPVALWRHFPGDDQRAGDLAAATIEWQRRYDWDFVKVTPASSFCLADYGVQDKWVGSIEGTREFTRQVVNKSLDWTDLRPLDPNKGALTRQSEALTLIKTGLNDDTPILQTIFSPLAQAKHIADPAMVIKHMRTAPDRLKTGLNAITDSTLRFIDSIRRSKIAGAYYAIQLGGYGDMTPQEYAEFGRPYDLQILRAFPNDWWFNMLHLHGDAPIFDMFLDYPVQALNWHDRETEPSLAIGKTKFKGAVCGGLGHWDAVHNGTPSDVRTQARDALQQTEGRRFILSTGCVTMITSPLSNLRAVREAVEIK
jgi:uroporphyrinogen decarboxylase